MPQNLSLLCFLTLVLLNIRGAVRNQFLLKEAIASLSTQPDIIALTETWMEEGDIIAIPNYVCWSNPQCKGPGGGGTLFLIHRRLLPTCTPVSQPHKANDMPPQTHTHSQWIRLISSNKPYYISLTYVSPNNANAHQAELDATVDNALLYRQMGTCIHLGDFNNPNTVNGHTFNKFKKSLRVSSLLNKKCISQQTHGEHAPPLHVHGWQKQNRSTKTYLPHHQLRTHLHKKGQRHPLMHWLRALPSTSPQPSRRSVPPTKTNQTNAQLKEKGSETTTWTT